MEIYHQISPAQRTKLVVIECPQTVTVAGAEGRRCFEVDTQRWPRATVSLSHSTDSESHPPQGSVLGLIKGGVVDLSGRIREWCTESWTETLYKGV